MRILLADDNAARAGALTRVLAADPGLTVLRPRPGELLVDAVAALVPDVVLVDMARPDRDGLEGIRAVASNALRPIVLFVDQDDPAFMEETIGAGVSSYNVLGVPPPDVKPILRAAAAMFRHHQTARTEPRENRETASDARLPEAGLPGTRVPPVGVPDVGVHHVEVPGVGVPGGAGSPNGSVLSGQETNTGSAGGANATGDDAQ
jgi:two-component system, response regulator / RNA-binding antiterminator